LHNTASDCWVAYSGNVYDITDFLSQHQAPLDSYCGTSTEFEQAYSAKHYGSKDDFLEQYKIGILI